MKYLNILALSLLSSSMLFSSSLFAEEKNFVCKLHLAKGECWQDYEVKVQIMNAVTYSVKKEVKLAANEMSKKEEFPCHPREQITFTASYSPEIWQGDKSKLFDTNKIWNTPSSLSETAGAWIVKICYPKQFSEVPLPAGAGKDCKCNFSE